MSLALSTKVKLLAVLEDIELLSKSLFDALSTRESTPAATTGSGGAPAPPPELNCDSLVEQLRQKELELHQLRAQAASQQLAQTKVAQLRALLDQRDQEIGQFQRSLKEADRLLTVAIYYSRQKLEALQTSRQNPADSEDLVKFAHKISASNGVMAPLGWGIGDPRRPYPTANEMDRGFLRHIDELGNFKQEITEEVAASTSDSRPGPRQQQQQQQQQPSAAASSGVSSAASASGATAAASAAAASPAVVSGSPQQAGYSPRQQHHQQQQQQPTYSGGSQTTPTKSEPMMVVENMSSDSSSSDSSED